MTNHGSMIKNISASLFVRSTSLVCLVLTVALDILLSGNFSFWDYSVLALSSSSIIHFSPKPGETSRLSLWFSIGTAFMMISLESLTGHVACLAVVAMTVVLTYTAIRMAGHYDNLQHFFSIKEIKLSVEKLSSWFMFAVAAVLMTALLVFKDSPVVGVVIAPLAIAYYVILCQYSYISQAVAMETQRKETPRERIPESENSSPDSDSCPDLFSKIVSILESEKLFLDESLTIKSLANAVGTNRTYLSRVVNAHSGKHVPTFINSYRINYAMEKLKENPHQRIGEMYAKCGFKTHSNFDMTFKMFSGMTPSEYAMTVSVEKLKSYRESPSKTREREQ